VSIEVANPVAVDTLGQLGWNESMMNFSAAREKSGQLPEKVARIV
jgi:hypothetical protein